MSQPRPLALATTSRLLLALARLKSTPDTYRRLADAVPLVGRDALRHADLLNVGQTQASWTSKLRYLYTTIAITRHGEVTAWYRAGVQHRDYDLPAEVWEDGDRKWCVARATMGELWASLTIRRYQNGELHRDGDKPAYVGPNGGGHWYQRGRKHRDGDKPAIEWPDGGGKEWYCNNERHRDGGRPAVERPGDGREWWIRGRLVTAHTTTGELRGWGMVPR